MLPIRPTSAITAATRRVTQLPYQRVASRPTSRALSSTARSLFPAKDTQDKDSLNPTSTEYSKSSGDDAAAQTTDAAFNPNKTSPEEETATANRESGEVRKSGPSDTNPLDVSPGNPEISKPRDPTEGGADKAPQKERARTSGHGSPKKAGGGKSG
ncbi:hypothetical protein IWX90DRAFT_510597 [Phyllosticta citrichinensis]|uniref:Uncharacterized protein n=1 Tax=Phyllosticta citrichinensis TaxID=1130410 RepID=A0ABR1Y7Q3_9PEZI